MFDSKMVQKGEENYQVVTVKDKRKIQIPKSYLEQQMKVNRLRKVKKEDIEKRRL